MIDRLLELDAVSFRYPADRDIAAADGVIERVSFTVGAGELVLVTGTVGVGKTTLARLGAGGLTPTAGTVERTQRVWFTEMGGAGLPPTATIAELAARIDPSDSASSSKDCDPITVPRRPANPESVEGFAAPLIPSGLFESGPIASVASDADPGESGPAESGPVRSGANGCGQADSEPPKPDAVSGSVSSGLAESGPASTRPLVVGPLGSVPVDSVPVDSVPVDSVPVHFGANTYDHADPDPADLRSADSGQASSGPPKLGPGESGAHRCGPANSDSADVDTSDWRPMPSATELAGRLGVRPHDLARPIGQLSYGNRQKAIIALALGNSAHRLVIFDEPFAGVDTASISAIVDTIGQARRCGVGLFVVDSLGAADLEPTRIIDLGSDHHS